MTLQSGFLFDFCLDVVWLVHTNFVLVYVVLVVRAFGVLNVMLSCLCVVYPVLLLFSTSPTQQQ